MLRSILNNRLLFCLLLAIPAAALVFDFGAGGYDGARMLEPTGEFAVRMMVIAMMIGPALDLFGRRGWLLWLQARRRYLGVGAFSYALLHFIFYVVDMGALTEMLAEIDAPGIWTGYLAFILMMIVAMISNNASMRWLKRAWKQTQRLAYPAAALTAAHWIFLEWETIPAIVHFGPLLALNLARVIKLKGQKA